MLKTASVTVRMDQKMKDRLVRAAKSSNRSVSDLLVEAAKKQIEYENWFRAQVKEGLEDIRAGHTVSHETVLSDIQARAAARITARKTKRSA